MSTHIKVVAYKRAVYLMGELSSQEAGKLADVALQVGGVQRVVKVFDYQSGRGS